jgi:lipoprotein-releasing system ATP-binding protein
MLPAEKLAAYSKEEIEHRAIEKLKLVGMDEYAHKHASRLSGGQQQRVAIARALINDPSIIMGDEPTGNLDKTNSQMVFDIFRRLSHENNQTIITVTHDPDFANGGDRIVEMQDGQIIGRHATR